MCLVPSSPTSSALDAVVLTDDSVVTVQMTIASTDDARKLGFDHIYMKISPLTC